MDDMPNTAVTLEDLAVAITRLGARMDEKFDNVDGRLDAMDRHFARNDAELTNLSVRLLKVEDNTQRLTTDIGGLKVTVDKIYANLDARLQQEELDRQERLVLSAQVGRLNRWAKKVAPKVGVSFKE